MKQYSIHYINGDTQTIKASYHEENLGNLVFYRGAFNPVAVINFSEVLYVLISEVVE